MHGRKNIGDVSLSAEDRPIPIPKPLQPILAPKQEAALKRGGEGEHDEHEEVADDTHLGGDTAMKFLLAGGIAGAGTESFTISSFDLPPRLTAQNQCRAPPPHRLTVSEYSSSHARRLSAHSRRTPSYILNAVREPSAGRFSRYMQRVASLGSGSGMASTLPRSFPCVLTCFLCRSVVPTWAE